MELQLLGTWHGDERLTAVARWLAEVHFGTAPESERPGLLALAVN